MPNWCMNRITINHENVNELERIAGLESNRKPKKHLFIIHFMGVLYGKLRKPFVAFDRYIQQKANKLVR